MSRVRTTSVIAATTALGAVTALSLASGAGAQGTRQSCVPAPGQVEAVKVNNLQAIIDDSDSMRKSDPDRLRVAGIEQFITNPENASKTLGVVEFGTNAATVFARANVGNSRGAMIALLRSQVRADNGSTNYDKGFIKASQDNPAAEARIFLTDGAHDGAYQNSHRGGPRTFVVGLGIGRTGASARRLQQIANETGGVYFPNVAVATLQPTFRTISAAVNCLPIPRTFRTRRFTKKGQTSTRTVRIAKGTKRMDLVLNWAQPSNRFVFSRVSLLGRKNRVLATLSGKGKPRKLRITKGSGKTFRSLSFKKSKGTRKLRFRVAARRVVKPERALIQLTERTE